MKHQWLLLLLLMLFLSACNLAPSGSITPSPTPDLPTVEILAPLNNQQVIEGIEFDFDIVARDTTQGIALVSLYIDGVLVNEATPLDGESVPVFRTTMNWLAQAPGRHLIEAIAYRPDGTQGDPAIINLDVVARN